MARFWPFKRKKVKNHDNRSIESDKIIDSFDRLSAIESHESQQENLEMELVEPIKTPLKEIAAQLIEIAVQPITENYTKEQKEEDFNKLLKENGTDIHARDSTDKTILHLTAPLNNSLAFNFLREQGADISKKDTNGDTAMHILVATASSEVIHESIVPISSVNNSGNTLLHIAASRGEDITTAVVQGKTLYVGNPVPFKASIIHSNNEKKTPIEIALEKDDVNTASYLLATSQALISDEIRGDKLPARELTTIWEEHKDKIKSPLFTDKQKASLKGGIETGVFKTIESRIDRIGTQVNEVEAISLLARIQSDIQKAKVNGHNVKEALGRSEIKHASQLADSPEGDVWLTLNARQEEEAPSIIILGKEDQPISNENIEPTISAAKQKLCDINTPETRLWNAAKGMNPDNPDQPLAVSQIKDVFSSCLRESENRGLESPHVSIEIKAGAEGRKLYVTNHTDEFNNTILHHIVQHNTNKIFEVLATKDGCGNLFENVINQANSEDKTPIELVLEKENPDVELVASLIKLGAIIRPQTEALVNRQSEEIRTAIDSNQEEVILSKLAIALVKADLEKAGPLIVTINEKGYDINRPVSGATGDTLRPVIHCMQVSLLTSSQMNDMEQRKYKNIPSDKVFTAEYLNQNTVSVYRGRKEAIANQIVNINGFDINALAQPKDPKAIVKEKHVLEFEDRRSMPGLYDGEQWLRGNGADKSQVVAVAGLNQEDVSPQHPKEDNKAHIERNPSMLNLSNMRRNRSGQRQPSRNHAPEISSSVSSASSPQPQEGIVDRKERSETYKFKLLSKSEKEHFNKLGLEANSTNEKAFKEVVEERGVLEMSHFTQKDVEANIKTKSLSDMIGLFDGASSLKYDKKKDVLRMEFDLGNSSNPKEAAKIKISEMAPFFEAYTRTPEEYGAKKVSTTPLYNAKHSFGIKTQSNKLVLHINTGDNVALDLVNIDEGSRDKERAPGLAHSNKRNLEVYVESRLKGKEDSAPKYKNIEAADLKLNDHVLKKLGAPPEEVKEIKQDRFANSASSMEKANEEIGKEQKKEHKFSKVAHNAKNHQTSKTGLSHSEREQIRESSNHTNSSILER